MKIRKKSVVGHLKVSQQSNGENDKTSNVINVEIVGFYLPQ